MKRASVIGKLFFVVSTFSLVQSQKAGTDCNGRSFYCLDPRNFQVCVDLPNGQTQTVDDLVYTCPTDLQCDNFGVTECDSPVDPPPGALVGDIDPPAISANEPSLPSTPFKCPGAGRFPHETDCRSYYNCLQLPFGIRQIRSSCLFGMAFNPVTQRCSSDESFCPTDFACTGTGIFADPADRRSYYRCDINGDGYSMYHMRCGIGQRFNENQGHCSLFGFRRGEVVPSELNQDELKQQFRSGRGGYN